MFKWHLPVINSIYLPWLNIQEAYISFPVDSWITKFKKCQEVLIHGKGGKSVHTEFIHDAFVFSLTYVVESESRHGSLIQVCWYTGIDDIILVLTFLWHFLTY